MHEAMRPSFRASLSAWGQALNLMTSETRSARVMEGNGRHMAAFQWLIRSKLH